MPDNVTKRTRRTPQEMADGVDAQIKKVEATISELEAKKQSTIDDYDQKISTAKARIKALEEKKQAILAPKPPRKVKKPRMTKKKKLELILKQAQKSGKTPEEIAQALGVELGE